MNKYIQGEIICKESLKISMESINSIKKILNDIGIEPEYKIETKKGECFKFCDLAEFKEDELEYEISKIEISKNLLEQDESIYIYIEINSWNSILQNYNYVCRTVYTLKDSNKSIILDSKIKEFYKNNKSYEHTFSKSKICEYLISMFVVIIIISVLKSFFNIESMKSSVRFFIIWIIIMALSTIINKINIVIFKPLNFIIGKYKDRYVKKNKVLSNIFWVVIVGTIISFTIGIVINIINNQG